MSIEVFLEKETELVLKIAQDAIQKILAGKNINEDEKMSILEMWLSLCHLNKLQCMHGSQTVSLAVSR